MQYCLVIKAKRLGLRNIQVSLCCSADVLNLLWVKGCTTLPTSQFRHQKCEAVDSLPNAWGEVSAGLTQNYLNPPLEGWEKPKCWLNSIVSCNPCLQHLDRKCHGRAKLCDCMAEKESFLVYFFLLPARFRGGRVNTELRAGLWREISTAAQS